MPDKFDILREKDPAFVSELERWQERFARQYDLGDNNQMADFAEAMQVATTLLPTNAVSATVSMSIGANGPTGLTVRVTPKED